MSMNLEQVRTAINNGITVYWHTSTAFKVFKQGDTLYMSNDAGDSLAVAHSDSDKFINGEPNEFYTVEPVKGKHHKIFSDQHVFFYPENIFGVNFSGYKISPMKFNTGDCSLSLASKCKNHEANFYSVFVIIPDIGRAKIADCATKEIAKQLMKTLSLVGEMYTRED